MSDVIKLYDRDFYAWTKEQADLLRTHQFAQLDIDHLLEELISMGKSERRELIARLEILLVHLLKWKYQPGYRGNSWKLTIEEQRERIQEHLDDNLSLAATNQLKEDTAKAYKHARTGASKETGLDRCSFPTECEWTVQTILDTTFYP